MFEAYKRQWITSSISTVASIILFLGLQLATWKTFVDGAIGLLMAYSLVVVVVMFLIAPLLSTLSNHIAARVSVSKNVLSFLTFVGLAYLLVVLALLLLNGFSLSAFAEGGGFLSYYLPFFYLTFLNVAIFWLVDHFRRS